MRVSLMKAATVVVTLSAVACATETRVTGLVVDAHGRPVGQALVSYTLRDRHFTASGAERIAFGTDIQARNDGRFEFTTTEPLRDLMIRADSPDLKRSAFLRHVTRSDNVLVIR
jgi:hypothetical protein